MLPGHGYWSLCSSQSLVFSLPVPRPGCAAHPNLYQKNDEDEKKLKAHCQKLLSGQSSNINHPALVKDKELIRLHLNNSYSVFTQNNRIQVLKDGKKKFSALLKALESACHHIHMEYYIIRDDDIGRKIRDILAAKAREGVEVRLLYDGMGCIALPKGYAKAILQSGGEVAVFFPPFFPHINVRVNYRNHRKIVVIDGKSLCRRPESGRRISGQIT